ncbi:hypothetical protein V8C34DRAFT_298938 [Trichoderma compactum]
MERPRIYFDSKSKEARSFSLSQINELSELAEVFLMGQDGIYAGLKAWKATDAPEPHIDQAYAEECHRH